MRRILFVATMVAAALSLYAAPRYVDAAKTTASSYLQNYVKGPRFNASSTDNMKLIKTAASTTDLTANAYYIFNTDDGYVIVAGDDRANDVLAYGDRPLDLNNIPDGLQYFLDIYQEEMDYLLANPTIEVTKDKVSFNASGTEYLLTALWDQSAPYYNLCPKSGNSRCLTGCPATSLAMIFYYWKWPQGEVGPVWAYTDMDGNSYDGLDATTFDWDNMLDSYSGSYTTTQGTAVATLMRYIGQEECMSYGTDGSGISSDSCEAIVRTCKFYGYDPSTVRLVKKTSDYYGSTTYYSDSEWAAMMQEEIANDRPIEFCAISSSGGHAFNVDGYNSSTNKYHINFGWSGDGNAWCSLNSFGYSGYSFNRYQQMVIGIQPPASAYGPTITAKPSDVTLNCYAGEMVTATFTVTGTNLTDGITLTLTDGNNVFTIDATNVTVTDAENGKVVTVTFAPKTYGTYTAKVTCKSTDAEDVIVNLTGIATLKTYDPVMLAANYDYVTNTSFKAEWTDETAEEFVSSYTLWVNMEQEEEEPEVKVLEDADSVFNGLEAVTNWQGYYTNQVNNYAKYLPEGWSAATNLYIADSYIISGGSVTTKDYDLTGYSKITVKVTAWSFNSNSYGDATITVSTTNGSQTQALSDDATTYTFVFDAAEADHVTITAESNYFCISSLKVYAGDASTTATLKAVAEEGGETYRIITGITPDKFYTVKDLQAGGTFYYKVKALYIDGTESNWSNTEVVTLLEEAPETHIVGDVNHDGVVDIMDVTKLIDRLVAGVDIDSEDDRCCEICCDVNGDGSITVSDVTALIDLVLDGAAE